MPRSHALLSVVALLSVSGTAIGAETPASCERLLAGSRPLYTELQALECMNHYFRSQDLDVPQGSFNRVSRLGYLALRRNPKNHETYLTLAWITYSQWRNSIHSPSDPSHANKHREVLSVLNEGRRQLPRHYLYLRDAALQLSILVRYAPEFPEYFDPAKSFNDAALVAARTPAEKVRILLNQGHLHRQNRREAEANDYYRRVLEIEPANEVACRYLDAC